MNIIRDLVYELNNGRSISEILREQQKYHEFRRWSVYDVIKEYPASDFDNKDRAALWHAARAELTTQPAGIRLAVDGVKEANNIKDSNLLGSKILHIGAAWSARYWLEEEAHHEVAYGHLLEMSGLPPIEHDEIVEHRGFFPSDNYARVCMLQACVEIEAIVTYGEMAKQSNHPLIKDIFHRIMKDEVQHRQYFISFAKSLIDSDVYQRKDILSMAYMWIRPDSGETHGSKRDTQSKREGFVNWWEHVETASDVALEDDQIRSQHLQDKKIRSVLAATSDATGIKINNIKQLKIAYFKSLTSNDIDRIRLAINNGDEIKKDAV
jgi:hypothetical protein